MIKDRAQWRSRARAFIRAEMARRGVTYAELAERMGEEPRNLTNKINRSAFEASLFLQALDALGVSVLRLQDDQ